MKKQYGEWFDTQKNMHKCPKCKCQIEKDGGCPHMQCSMCNYNWCWVCGLPCGKSDWWVLICHTFCLFYIEIIQFKGPCWLRFLMMVGLLLGVILLPAMVYSAGTIYFIGCIFVGPFYIWKEIYGRKCCMLLCKFLALIFYIPALVILYVLAAALAAPGLVILYFWFCFNILGMFFQWCLCSRKGKLGKHTFEGDLKKPIK